MVNLLNPVTVLGVTSTGTLVPLVVDTLGNSADPTGAYLTPFGYKVSKTENINTATGVDLFTVTGKCWITLWLGEVTDAFNASPTDYKLRIKTDNVDLCAATNLGSAAAGYCFSLGSDAGNTILQGSTYAVSAVKTADNNALGYANRLVGLSGGSLVLQSNRTAGASGDTLVHTIYYFPMESGASIVAA